MNDYYENQSLYAAAMGEDIRTGLPQKTERGAPIRTVYRHVTCDTVTYSTLPNALTYKVVYCSDCMSHESVREFVLRGMYYIVLPPTTEEKVELVGSR